MFSMTWHSPYPTWKTAPSELYEEVEAIDEDLSSLEDEFYGDDEDDDDCLLRRRRWLRLLLRRKTSNEVKCPNCDERNLHRQQSVPWTKAKSDIQTCGETLTLSFTDEDGLRLWLRRLWLPLRRLFNRKFYRESQRVSEQSVQILFLVKTNMTVKFCW